MGGRKREIDVDKLDDAQLRALVPSLIEQVAQLQRQIAEYQRMVFGRRSEKARYVDPKELLPFPEFAELRAEAKETEEAAETIEIPAHKRRRTKRRKDFPDHLPRRHTECTLNESGRACPSCGEIRQEIGETTAKELERIEFTYVHVIARKKYACRSCEGQVVTAPGIDRVLDKCILGANFLSQIIFERFGNHMPYARLEKKYAAEGLDLSRSVLCSSTLRCAELLEPVYEAHVLDVLASLETSVLQSDDTQAVQRNGPDPGQRKVHVWAWRDQHGGVFYEVTPTRNRDGPAKVIGDREGHLQCDGHDCYSGLDADRITRIGCWAHLRRYFDRARKAGDTVASKPLGWIRKVFAVERLAKQGRDDRPLTDEELVVLRQEQAAPVVAALKSWVDTMHIEQGGLPKGPLMEGVTYAINQWATLERFLTDGRIREISNNGCERALRAVVIGRKNWLWFGSEEGARAGAVLLSLVQSCKELGINPLLYLRDVLPAISSTPGTRVGALTPKGWKRHQERLTENVRIRNVIPGVLQELTFGA